MPIITKQFPFCAAHQYGHADWSGEKNHQVFGKDADVHGHNYSLEVSVTGPIHPDTGFVVDLGALSQTVKEFVIDHMDHSLIEKDIPWFQGKQPSSENMVVFIWEQIVNRMPEGVRLVKVKLRETPTIFSEYHGPEE